METLLIIGSVCDDVVAEAAARHRFTVHLAVDPAEGLAIVRRDHPALVMVDRHLGGGQDGVAVLKEVLGADPSCSAALLTAGGEVDVAIETLRAGALDYLRRPLDAVRLDVVFARAQEKRQRRQYPEPAAILVLEDHEPTLRRLMLILQKEGYAVAGAGDGERGLELFRRQRFDVILADMRMPGKDGIEVLRATKGAGADVEVIVSSGHGEEEQVVQALREGAVNFLRKPIDVEHMLLAVQKALEQLTIRRSLAYRNREAALMHELVVRLTHNLELVVETPGQLGGAPRDFLVQLLDTLPLGVAVIAADRRVVFANRHLAKTVGSCPPRLSVDWLPRMGIHGLTEESLAEGFARALDAGPGTIETVSVSQWSFIVMTPLRLVRQGEVDNFVALAIRGERRPQ